MKLVFVGDVHARSRKPVLRKDKDFLLTIITKLKYAIEQGDHIFFLGDILDIPDPTTSLVNYLIEFFYEYTRRGKHFYAIAGNHDLFGGNLETIHNTAFGTLLVSGCFSRLSQNPWTDDTFNRTERSIHVRGFDWGKKLEPPDRDKYGPGTYIAVVHDNYYYTRGKGVSFPYTQINGLRDLGYDIIISGHIHYDFSAFDTKGKEHSTLVINPGSLTRLTSHFLDKDRTPKVLVLDTTSDVRGSLTKLKSPFEEVELPYEKNIFSEEEFKAYVASIDTVNKFVEALQGMNLNTFYVEEVMNELAKAMNIPEEVVQCARTYLS